MAVLMAGSLTFGSVQTDARTKKPRLASKKITVEKGKKKKVKVKRAKLVKKLKIKMTKKAKKIVKVTVKKKKRLVIKGLNKGKTSIKVKIITAKKSYHTKLKIYVVNPDPNGVQTTDQGMETTLPTGVENATAKPQTTDQGDKSASAATQTPGVTNVPFVTNEPAGTKNPLATNEPEAAEATENPVTTENPEVTEATKNPSATDKPTVAEATKNPLATEGPEVTVAPIATEEPEGTKDPLITQAPAGTENPLATKAPVVADPTADPVKADCVDANITSDMGGVTTEYSESQGKMVLTEIHTGDWTKVSGVDFEDGADAVDIRLCSEDEKGSVEIYTDGLPGEENASMIASVPLINTGGNDTYEKSSAALTGSVSGIHDLYFVFRGKGYQIADWGFYQSAELTLEQNHTSLKLMDYSEENTEETTGEYGEENAEELDLSLFNIQQESGGRPVYDETTKTLSAVNVEQYILELPRELNSGESAKFIIKGVNNGTKGFRFWLSDTSFSNNSENIKTTDLEDFGPGEFTIESELTSNAASDQLLIKGISYGTFIDDVTISSIKVIYSTEAPEVREPKNPFQPETEQEYDAETITLSKSVREQLLGNKTGRVDSLLVGWRFIADPTTIEYDGRLYVYGTTDEIEFDAKANVVENKYNNHSLSCISTTDMVNWKDEGEIDVHQITDYKAHAWAPTIISKEIDGTDKFFIYYTTGGDGIAVLEADSPTGPWTDPIGKRLIDRKTPTCSEQEVPWLFDPGAFVDDDGKAYIYFGGGSAGTSSGRVCELGDDMISLKLDTMKELDPSYYFEDNEINKFGDTYYYSYCTNWKSDQNLEDYPWVGQAVIAYYTADNPFMENAEFGGMVFPNKGTSLYGNTYNNHHHMFTFKGETYIAYHSTYLEGALYGTKKGYRCLHIDKLNLDEASGDLSAEWTYEGAHLEPYINGIVEK